MATGEARCVSTQGTRERTGAAKYPASTTTLNAAKTAIPPMRGVGARWTFRGAEPVRRVARQHVLPTGLRAAARGLGPLERLEDGTGQGLRVLRGDESA